MCSTVFVYWAGLNIKELAAEHNAVREREIYALVNARLDPEWGEVERRTLPITFKAIDTLIQYQTLGDLYRIDHAEGRDEVQGRLHPERLPGAAHF